MITNMRKNVVFAAMSFSLILAVTYTNYDLVSCNTAKRETLVYKLFSIGNTSYNIPFTKLVCMD